MSEEFDDLEQTKYVQQALPELGRKYFWRGQEVKYGFAHRTAYLRIRDGIMTNLEADFLFLYTITRTPSQLDQVRSNEQISAFRVGMAEWVEANNLEAEYGDVHKLANEMQGFVDAVEAITPELPPKPKVPGAPTPPEPPPIPNA